MKSKTELFVVLARNAPVGVIFRRGPSKQVALIKWNLGNNTFEHGQWLKGRIYERRCDLSPDGDKLIYFAAKYGNKKGSDTWSAVSKPPYLTALAMWPKGDAWGGGGLFESELKILLNHPAYQQELAAGFNLGKNIQIHPCGKYSGGGEDSPIYHMRLLRDGWKFKTGKHPAYEKPVTQKQNGCFLQMYIRTIGKSQSAWYTIDYEVTNMYGESILKLPATSWADWDRKGNLLYAQGGKLFCLYWKNNNLDPVNAKELADFSDLTFKEVIAPAKFRKW